MNFKKIAAVLLSAMCVATVFTGCGANTEQAEKEKQAQEAEARASMEIKLNDYRGAVTRTNALKDNVLKTMDAMKTNNATLRTDNPNSFWTTDGYQDFVVNFLSNAIIKEGEWFNEEETDWDAIVKALSTNESSFTKANDGSYALISGVTIERNEKDDYSINGVPFKGKFSTDSTTFEGKGDYRFLYDCDKDWAKAYAELDFSSKQLPTITSDLYEYARLDDNTFAVQTPRERLLVVFAPVEGDTDFRAREVKEFYYSKLTQDGMRTTFEGYVPLAEYDEETGKHDQAASQRNKLIQGYKVVNDKGDIATQYGVHDSLFLTDDIVKNISTDWVFEDKSLQQAICYKDKALVVTTYNKLSEKYERFTYSADSVKDEDIAKLEALVTIEGLVGEQAIPELEIPEVDPKDFAEKETEAPTEVETETSSEADEAQKAIDDEMDKIREQAENRQDGDVETVDSTEATSKSGT